MKLSIPSLKRTISNTTIASFGNTSSSSNSSAIKIDNETLHAHDYASSSSDDDDSMYRVDSMIFESVSIPPRSTNASPLPPPPPPPVIRISVATTSSGSRSSSESTGSADSSAPLRNSRYYMTRPLQPLVPDTNTLREKSLPPWVTQPSALYESPYSSSNSLPTSRDIEGAGRTTSSKLARTLFFLGFLFPLLWIVGACLIWRRVDYARSDLSPSPTPSPSPRAQPIKPHPQVAPQGLYIQRVGALHRSVHIDEKAAWSPYGYGTGNVHGSNRSLATTTSVSVHLPWKDDRWAWACLWAIGIFSVVLSVTFLALYGYNVI